MKKGRRSLKPLFGRQKKKLHANQNEALDEAVKVVIKNPQAGEPKKGELN